MRRALLVACALLLACGSDDPEMCDDGLDNDGDQLVDCEDDTCAGLACAPNGLTCAPNGTCSICSGNGGRVEAEGEVTCGDAADNDCDGGTDCDDPDCRPRDGAPGRVCDTLGQTCSAPDALGRSTCGGSPYGAPQPLGSIVLLESEHQVLGARGSGYQEQGLLTFQLRTSDGAPFPAGLRVTFSHESLGGSYVGAAPSCSATSPAICTAEATTDASGNVRVLLTSGRSSGELRVRAEATSDGSARYVVSGGFTVVGARPSGARFSVDCSPYNVPALTVHDCAYSRYHGAFHEVSCVATLGDRHGNLVAVPTLVSFRSEAGQITPAALTPAYDPATRDPALGQAVGLLEVQGGPLPADVDPFPAESSVASFDYGCGPRTTNPRDGLVSVIALVEGEEGFVDLDLDGTWEAGEPFVDLGEPFLDEDDDGVRSPGEWFMDLDDDGTWTGPNGRWDGDTVLWTPGRVLYTGYPLIDPDDPGNFTRFYQTGTPPAPTAPVSSFTGSVGPPPTTTPLSVFFTDQHLNPLGPTAAFNIRALAEKTRPVLTAPTHTADSLATTFQLWYCDDPSGSRTCNDGPLDRACLWSPCYLVPRIGTAFLYGNHATARITCQQQGDDVVQVEAAVEGVWSFLSIAGTCTP